jgi:uncharacterized protein
MFGPKAKGDVFFQAFVDHATRSVEASKLVLEMLEKETGKDLLAAEISEKESAGDKITHQTVKRLHETWITPLDRTDIHALISKLDDVLDLTEAVAERLMLYQITAVRPLAVDLAKVLVKGCEQILGAMKLFPRLSAKGKELLEVCVEVNRLENEADAIFDTLEDATDRCEDVANIVEGVVLEYA